MKSVLISIKPYWVFLIIAKTMGWNIDKEKTVEVRKTYPKDGDWNKVVKIYCTKGRESFDKIPKEYQPFMKRFLGKVIGEFVCDNIAKGNLQTGSCLSMQEMAKYANGKQLYGWNISDLVIYDKPKELYGFMPYCKYLNNDDTCKWEQIECDCQKTGFNPDYSVNEVRCLNQMTRPPQSWCYVEESKE